MARIIKYIPKRHLNTFKEDLDVFNLSDTGNSWGNDFLNPKDHEYIKLVKGFSGQIVYMTSDEYFKRCADIRGKGIESEYNSIDQDKVNKYTDMIKQGVKFDLPILDYAFRKSQEGRHRMLAANQVYPNQKFPCLVITKFNQQKELGFTLYMQVADYGLGIYYINKKTGEEEYLRTDRSIDEIKQKAKELIDSGIAK